MIHLCQPIRRLWKAGAAAMVALPPTNVLPLNMGPDVMTWPARRLRTTLLFLLLAMGTPRAEEGAFSLYLQGTRDDFGAALWGAPGVVSKTDLFLFDGSAGARPLGGRLALDSSARFSGALFKLAWQSDLRIFGARFGAAAVLPVFFDMQVNASAQAGGVGVFSGQNIGGLGDIYVAPAMLNWQFGNHHITAAPGLFAPTGRYASNRLANLGRNYWGFDIGGAYTWLEPTQGHEISLSAGYLINTRNDATGYRSGDSIHVDWMIGQHLSRQIGVGFVGYWYQQVTNDTGGRQVLTRNGFRGEAVGLGAALRYTPQIAGRDVNFFAKWLHDVHAVNRISGDMFLLSAAFTF